MATDSPRVHIYIAIHRLAEAIHALQTTHNQQDCALYPGTAVYWALRLVKAVRRFFCARVKALSTSGEINSPLFVIYCDIAACIERWCLIKAKDASMQCYFVLMAYFTTPFERINTAYLHRSTLGRNYGIHFLTNLKLRKLLMYSNRWQPSGQDLRVTVLYATISCKCIHFYERVFSGDANGSVLT